MELEFTVLSVQRYSSFQYVILFFLDFCFFHDANVCIAFNRLNIRKNRKYLVFIAICIIFARRIIEDRWRRKHQ